MKFCLEYYHLDNKYKSVLKKILKLETKCDKDFPYAMIAHKWNERIFTRTKLQ